MMAGSLTVLVSATACLVLALWAANQTGLSSAFQLPFFASECHGPGSLSGYYVSTPYSSSWTSWWSKDRHLVASDGTHLGTTGRGQGGGTIGKDWNILYHLGGNGPWIEKADGILDGGIALPEGCMVEQVHMVSRNSYRNGQWLEIRKLNHVGFLY